VRFCLQTSRPTDHRHRFTAPNRFVTLKNMAGPFSVHPRLNLSPSSTTITSRDNRWLKRFRSALSGEHGEDGLVGVEGARLVQTAVGSLLYVEAMLVSNSGERHLKRVAPLLPAGVQILRTSDRLFAGIADTQAPQGIAALVRPTQTTIEALVRGTALVVVLVGVQDPGNVGTILRAAEAFGATGSAACPAGSLGTADPFGPKALRASAGSALRIPLVLGLAAGDLLAKFRAVGVKTYAAVAASGDDEGGHKNSPVLRPWEIAWKSSAALLIGNEGVGLPADIVQSADARVWIPQVAVAPPVGVESLNAAMAATVLLYEAMRQRNLR
jgi:TrmH family RNA methyltransferase